MTGIAGAILWLIVAILFLLAESMTAQMISIWFGAGALVTILPAAMGVPFAGQMTVFLIVSVIVLLALRPVAKRRFVRDKQSTNADMVVGMIGIVTETVDNDAQSGRVTANGLAWTARTEDDDLVIEPEQRVRVVRIEGVKLIVAPLTEKRRTTV